jgi:hypothetical protein
MLLWIYEQAGTRLARKKRVHQLLFLLVGIFFRNDLGWSWNAKLNQAFFGYIQQHARDTNHQDCIECHQNLSHFCRWGQITISNGGSGNHTGIQGIRGRYAFVRKHQHTDTQSPQRHGAQTAWNGMPPRRCHCQQRTTKDPKSEKGNDNNKDFSDEWCLFRGTNVTVSDTFMVVGNGCNCVTRLRNALENRRDEDCNQEIAIKEVSRQYLRCQGDDSTIECIHLFGSRCTRIYPVINKVKPK